MEYVNAMWQKLLNMIWVCHTDSVCTAQIHSLTDGGNSHLATLRQQQEALSLQIRNKLENSVTDCLSPECPNKWLTLTFSAIHVQTLTLKHDKLLLVVFELQHTNPTR